MDYLDSALKCLVKQIILGLVGKKENVITEIIIMLITYEIDYAKNNINSPILCILKSWKLDWYTCALTKHYDLRDFNRFSMHTVTAGRTRTRTFYFTRIVV